MYRFPSLSVLASTQPQRSTNIVKILVTLAVEVVVVENFNISHFNPWWTWSLSLLQIDFLTPSTIYKSSHRRCSVRKGVLRNFAKLTGKHVCQSLFFSSFRPEACSFIKKGLWHRCFPVNFVKFLRTPFLQNTSGRLLLHLIIHHSQSTIIVLVIKRSWSLSLTYF